MKLALRGLLVLVVAGCATQMGAAAPPPARMRTVPYSGFFWTPQDGLLGVGLCTSTKYMCGTGAVELTTDGGRTYRVVFRTRHPVTEIQSFGRSGAIVRIGHRTYRTLDGGRSWHPWHAAEGVSYATPRVGLRFRDYQTSDSFRVRLLRTEDGGRTWLRLPALPSGLCGWVPILDLVTAQRGWMVCVGQPGAGNEEKEVFSTRNGGHSWQAGAWAVAENHPESRGGLGFLGYPAGISFARNGFGLMWESRGTLLVTRDGGKTWRSHSRFAKFDVDFGLGGSAFANGTAFVLFRHSGTSYRAFVHGWATARLIETRDFGRSWHIVRRWRNY